MSSALTKRERQVMLLRSEGLYSSEIATSLKCKKRTVDMHLYNVYKKTGIRNLAELLKYVNDNMKD